MDLPEHDFLLEELYKMDSFLKLTHGPGFVDSAEWEEWFVEHARFQKVNALARRIYEISYYEKSLFDGSLYREQVWSGIAAHLDRDLGGHMPTKIKRHAFLRWLPYAALLLCLCSLGWWFYLQHTIRAMGNRYAAQEQPQEFRLPDGSTLWLNKNSSAVYDQNDSTRILEILGEGHLHVLRQMAHGRRKPFIVDRDGFKVEVLGTKFNVVNTASTKLVALHEGSVRATFAQQQILLKPGEVVHLDSGLLQRMPLSPGLLNSWQTGVLELDNTSLRELMLWMELAYGKKIVNYLPANLAEMTVSGKIAVRDRPDVIRSLGRLYHISIREEHNNMIITNEK